MGQKLVSTFEESKSSCKGSVIFNFIFSMSSLKSHYYIDFFMENILFLVVVKFLESGILTECNMLILA